MKARADGNRSARRYRGGSSRPHDPPGIKPSTDFERLAGTVERVTFHNEESGFCVLRIAVSGKRDLLTVVGLMSAVVPGEWIEARGMWVRDREHGLQFKAEELSSVPPTSPAGIERFLGSGLIKGIGPVYARKLVEAFGTHIFDVIEKESARLEKVDGIGRLRRLQIKESWNQTRTVRAIMAFLLGHGLSTNRAYRIYKTYGEQALQTVRDDPYCLARDIRGIGFKLADRFAANLGVDPRSDQRARAGIEYVLQEISNDGHVAFPRPGLIEQAVKLLEIPDDIVERAVDHGIETQRLVQDHSPGFDDPLIYLRPLYEAEAGLARTLLRLAGGQTPCPPFDEQKALTWVEQQIQLSLASEQRSALLTLCRAKLAVMTGGPGVGKTTLINALIRIFRAKKLRVVLAAPTGRAAKRMQETSGHRAATIHRLLAFNASTGGFRHGADNPLEGDIFIVDESSMLDVVLAYQLVRAIPPHAALFFVGDMDQLPSVGPGTVLRDLIQSNVFPICRLVHVFRQAATSDIIANAHRIHDGQMPFLRPKGEKTDFYLLEAEDPADAADRLIELVTRHIPRRFGFDPRNDIQVLTPMRRGVLGANDLNRRLQECFAPPPGSPEPIEYFGNLYRVGDKVMQQSNDYEKDVFNGDMGRISRVEPEERVLFVEFDGREVAYEWQELDELEPCYAITVHKSQGGEYPCVIVPVHTTHYIMLRRNLIYTAVTRGRRLVVLVGTRRAVGLAVRREDTHQRLGALAVRLASASP